MELNGSSSKLLPLTLRQVPSLANMNQKTTRPIQKLAKAVSQCSVEVRSRVTYSDISTTD